MHKFHLLKEDGLWKLTKEEEPGDYFNSVSRRLVLNFGHCYMLVLEGTLTIHNEDGSIKFIFSYPMPKGTKYYASSSRFSLQDNKSTSRNPHKLKLINSIYLLAGFSLLRFAALRKNEC